MNPLSTDPSRSHESRQEAHLSLAGPLPVKCGEIGFAERLGTHPEPVISTPEVILPARHPADRPPTQLQPILVNAGLPAAAAQRPRPSSPTLSIDSASNSTAKQKKGCLILRRLFRDRRNHKFCGVAATTVIKLILQMLLFIGTVAGWAISTLFLQGLRQRDGKIPGGQSSTIFMHVVFCVATIGQVFFLKHRWCSAYEEWNLNLHPGQVPRRRMNRSMVNILNAPWNNPPLPTYDTAVANHHGGTGDIEDPLIIQAPPPSYGDTHGSLFSLSGHLDEELRARRPPSVHSVGSLHARPRSYVSEDAERWEIIQGARRAEVILSMTEEGRSPRT